MDEMTTVHAVDTERNLCPAFLSPDGTTGCQALAMAKTVEELNFAINGSPAYPGKERQIGLVETMTTFIADERGRRWKRSDKIAAAGILLLVLAWPSAEVWTFVVDVYHVTQEWHQLHKTELEKIPKISADTGEVTTAHQTKPQDSTIRRSNW